MTPREERVLFTYLVAKLLLEINRKVWAYGKVEIALDEWTVHSQRIYIDSGTGQRRMGIDRIHNPKGFHPRGLAVDFLVYINGTYVTSGSHPIWRDLDEMAHALHPKLNFGNEFNDSNHLSIFEVK